jgi:DNA modification methylase
MAKPHAARQESVFVGDARSIPLPNGSVQCVVTSPPYYGLRDYGVDGQIGSEGSLDEFLSTMVDVMREVRRVLRDDGTVWLNMGDSFASPTKGSGGTKGFQTNNMGSLHGSHRTDMAGLPQKCKMLVPHRLAIALCDDGWIVRQDIVWAKPNPMPESTRDRPTTAHEFVFLLAKNPRYYYDAEAVRERAIASPQPTTYKRARVADPRDTRDSQHESEAPPKCAGRNKRSVWTIPSHSFSDAHFATFPPKLVEPCIKAGTAQRVCPTCGAQWVREVHKEPAPASVFTGTARTDTDVYAMKVTGSDTSRGMGSKLQDWRNAHPPSYTWCAACDCPDNDGSGSALVLDPFCGSGTTGVVARQMGRAFFGVELNPEYAEMARRRIAVEGEGRARSEQADGSVHEQQVLAI